MHRFCNPFPPDPPTPLYGGDLTKITHIMPGKGGNFVKLPSRASQVGEAQVPKGMGAEVGDPSSEHDSTHHFRPGPKRDGHCPVTLGLGQEERTSGPAER